MDGNPHRVFAASTWVTGTTLIGAPLWIVAAGAPVSVVLAGGFSSPDIDNSQGWKWLLRSFPGKFDDKVFGHRRLTHWWGWPAILMYLTYTGVGHGPWFVWALLWGWMSHVIADFIFGKAGYGTPKGVPMILWFAHAGLGLKSGCRSHVDPWTGKKEKGSPWLAGDRWFAAASTLLAIVLVWHGQTHPAASVAIRSYGDQMLMHAWSSTLPGHQGSLPRPGDPCAVTECEHVLVEGEEAYFTVEMPGQTGRNLAVCWRHVDRETRGPHPVTIQEIRCD